MKKTIARDKCQTLQQTADPHDCFGCASQLRVCRMCRQDHVVVPEIDLCSNCLQSECAAEAGHAPEFGEKICENCHEKVVYYPNYTLCLGCTVKRFPSVPTQQSNGRARSFDEYYQHARHFLKGRSKITLRLLMDELGLSQVKCEKVILRLESERIIGPPRGCHGREVFNSPQEKEPTELVIRKPAPAPPSVLEETTTLPATDQGIVRMALSLLRDRVDELIRRAEP